MKKAPTKAAKAVRSTVIRIAVAATVGIIAVTVVFMFLTASTTKFQHDQYSRQTKTFNSLNFPAGYKEVNHSQYSSGGESAAVYTEYTLTTPPSSTRQSVAQDLAVVFGRQAYSMPSSSFHNEYTNEYTVNNANGYPIKILFVPYANNNSEQPNAAVTSVKLTVE